MGNLSNQIAKILVGLLVGVMILSFAVWGMEDVFNQGGRNAVVTLGDEPIEAEDFRESFRREVNRLNQDREQGLTNEEAFTLGVHRRVLDQMVTAKALDIDAEDLGIGVDAELAREVIRDLPGMTNPVTGELDSASIETAARRMGLTRAGFEKEIVDSLRREQIVPAIVDGIAVPSEFARQRFRYLSEQRAADMITLSAENVPAPAEPTEAELSDWIEANAARYTAPEFRRFVLLRVEPFDISPDMTVTDEELREEYDFRVSLPPSSNNSLAVDQTRDVVQIQTASEADAKAAAERLAAGEDPAQVAASLGTDSPTTYEDASKATIVDARVAEAAFNLEDGRAEAVFGSLPFWYAVSASDFQGGEPPTFEEARPDVEAALLKERALDQLFDLTDAIQDAMDDNKTFEEMSEELGVPLSFYDYLDREGRTEDGLLMNGFSRIPGIASDDEILREVFVSDIGFETDLFESSNDGYFAVRVLDIKDSTLRPMEEIRERAVADFKADKVATALKELAVELQGRLRAGETLEVVAAELGLEVDRQVLGRAVPNPAIGPQVAVGLLDGKVGAVARGPGVEPGTQQVAVLARVQGTTDSLAGEFAAALDQQAQAEIAADIQTAYRAAILAENPVAQNDARIRQVLGLDDN